MKIVIEEDPKQTETDIIIRCHHVDEQVLSLAARLSSSEKIIGKKGENLYPLEAQDILYIDTVDKKTFFYTEKEVFESSMRLYELEDLLKKEHFFKASKSLLINLMKVGHLSPELGGRLEVTMENGEILLVSRQYTSVLKKQLKLR